MPRERTHTIFNRYEVVMTSLLAIDFEASCLPRHGRSFPIEVGVADGEGWSRAWLISPHADWDDWHWTSEAENVHGITREQIDRDGLPAARVVTELVSIVSGRHLIADSHLDHAWFETLCAAAAVPVPFQIGHIEELASELNSSPDDISYAIQTANHRVPERHRAATDALWLAAVARHLEAANEGRAPQNEPLFPWAGARKATAEEMRRYA